MTSIILRVQSFDVKDGLLPPFTKSIQCLQKSPRLYSAVKTVVVCVFQLLNRRSKFSCKIYFTGTNFCSLLFVGNPAKFTAISSKYFFSQLSLLVHKQFIDMTSLFSVERLSALKKDILNMFYF